MKNIFLCLVHERPECVMDLVHNLRHFDPASDIVLYNGGPNIELLWGIAASLPENVIIHPEPQKQNYTREDVFFYDCVRLLLNRGIEFNTLTVVDSDQLLIRSGYSQRLAEHLNPKIGMFTTYGHHDHSHDHSGDFGNVHIASAKENREHYASLAKHYPDFNRHFAQWAFFPHHVHTRASAMALFNAWESNLNGARDVHFNTKQSVTCEILLPTLSCLFGFEAVIHPTNLHFSRWRVDWTVEDLAAALQDPNVFWMHPVPRLVDNPVRSALRAYAGY